MLSVFCFAMEPVIIISYILLFVMIPIGLLLISVKVFGEGTRPLTIFGKLLLSFVVHFAASIFALFFVISSRSQLRLTISIRAFGHRRHKSIYPNV